MLLRLAAERLLVRPGAVAELAVLLVEQPEPPLALPDGRLALREPPLERADRLAPGLRLRLARALAVGERRLERRGSGPRGRRDGSPRRRAAGRAPPRQPARARRPRSRAASRERASASRSVRVRSRSASSARRRAAASSSCWAVSRTPASARLARLLERLLGRGELLGPARDLVLQLALALLEPVLLGARLAPELLDLLARSRERDVARRERLVPRALLALELVDPPLVRGDDLDELLLLPELLEQEPVDGGAVLALLLHEQLACLREPAPELLDLVLERRWPSTSLSWSRSSNTESSRSRASHTSASRAICASRQRRSSRSSSTRPSGVALSSRRCGGRRSASAARESPLADGLEHAIDEEPVLLGDGGSGRAAASAAARRASGAAVGRGSAAEQGGSTAPPSSAAARARAQILGLQVVVRPR